MIDNTVYNLFTIWFLHIISKKKRQCCSPLRIFSSFPLSLLTKHTSFYTPQHNVHLTHPLIHQMLAWTDQMLKLCNLFISITLATAAQILRLPLNLRNSFKLVPISFCANVASLALVIQSHCNTSRAVSWWVVFTHYNLRIKSLALKTHIGPDTLHGIHTLLYVSYEIAYIDPYQ